MTREEQIYNESRKQRSVSEEVAFRKGAEWADNNPNWISVEERLPEENAKGESDVVLVTDGKHIFHGYYWRRINDWISLFLIPTHWMPIPKPPKKGE